jgi:hypothetical protein
MFFVSRGIVRIYGQANKFSLLICSPFFKDRDVCFSFVCSHLYYFSIIPLLQFKLLLIYFWKP